MPEGLKGEPEEDDGVEEAVQTMGPEDLQNRKAGGDAGEGGGGREGGESRKDIVTKRKAWKKKECGELQLSR